MASSSSTYRIRDITFFGSPRRVLMQSSNGPCPLLAACNVLSLRNQLSLPKGSSVGFQELVQLLSNFLLDVNSRERDEVRIANIERNLESCIDVLPRLNVGLDVNCRFSGPRDFEYTQELTVFDLLDISIVHGWVVAPEDKEAVRVIGNSSYNALTERLVRCEEAQAGTVPEGEDLTRLLEEGAVVRDFLSHTAAQLTFEGLIALHGTLKERELATLFRNQHFSTLLKHDGSLYLLCTDIGFLDGNAVWERLDAVDGDTMYLGADFKPPGRGSSSREGPGGSSSAPPALAGRPLAAAPAAAAPPAAAPPAKGMLRAHCEACGTLNEFSIPGSESTVQCGACTFRFRLRRPPAFLTRTCQSCAALNRFPAPAAGQPDVAMQCGACGKVT